MKNKNPKFKKKNKTPSLHQGRTPQSPIGKASLYGMHAVQEALNNPDRHIRQLYTVDGAKKPETNVDSVIITKQEMNKMLPQGAVHQGVSLDCGPLPEIGAQDLIIRHRNDDNSLILMLDQVTDPHNVGAIIRSCAAFGAHGVIMQKKHAPELTGVLAKTACGGIEHVPVTYETNLSRTIESLKEGGYFVYGLAEAGKQSISDLKPGGKSVIVLGAEGSGLRRLVMEHCDALVHLPTKPPIGSLNVSNAAAVALYAMLA